LDGNVFRVLSRIFNWATPIDSSKGKKEFREMAQTFLYETDPAKHNQAIMEFGALLCTPKKPQCEICPIQAFCEAFKMKTINVLPVKSKKNSVRTRHFHFLHIESNNEILIEKRRDKDIWQHLYQLPLIEIDTNEKSLSKEILLKYKISSQPILVKEPIQHLLSHQKLTIHFYTIKLKKKIDFQDLDWVNVQNLKDYPFPKPLVDYLDL
jgi:A/G-specific adenine glycosylase